MKNRTIFPIIIVLATVVTSCAPWYNSYRPCTDAICAAQANQESQILDDTVARPLNPHWLANGVDDMEPECQAASMFFDDLASGEDFMPLEGISCLMDIKPQIHVAKGHIGGFDYQEVIIGHRVSPDEPLPLLVLFHGRGDRPIIPEGYDAITEPVRILLPQARQELDEGYTWLPTWSRSPKKDLFANALRDVTDDLNNAIAQFAELRPTVGKPILMGFSQGGILSWTLAVRFPAQFSAVFPTAAWVPERLIPNSYPEDIVLPRVHAMHGSDDEVIPTHFGRKTVKKMRKVGWEVEWREYKGVEHYQTVEMENSLNRLLGETLGNNPEFIKVYDV